LASDKDHDLPLPNKSIPLTVAIIGTYEIAVALIGLLILLLYGGQADVSLLPLLILCVIYGLVGAGLWAIQEWARYTNVVLHIISIPHTVYTSITEDAALTSSLIRLGIAVAIVIALTRPTIQHKFKTVVPKSKVH
jgi:hypothetical protein